MSPAISERHDLQLMSQRSTAGRWSWTVIVYRAGGNVHVTRVAGGVEPTLSAVVERSARPSRDAVTWTFVTINRLAARFARAGLEQWIRAVDVAVRHPVARDDDDFDFLLAIQIGAMRGVVDMGCWEDNKTALIGRASSEQEGCCSRPCKRAPTRCGAWTGWATRDMRRGSATRS